MAFPAAVVPTSTARVREGDRARGQHDKERRGEGQTRERGGYLGQVKEAPKETSKSIHECVVPVMKAQTSAGRFKQEKNKRRRSTWYGGNGR